MDKILVNLDGASHGDPGESAIGAVLVDEQGNTLEEISQPIGRTTAHVAVYRSLIEACKIALDYAPRRVIFFTDNQLVANQVNGTARVRQPHLENLNRIAQELLGRHNEWCVRYVDRSANWNAHQLAEKALSVGNNNGVLSKAARDPQTSELHQKLNRLHKKDQQKVLEFVNHLLHKKRD